MVNGKKGIIIKIASVLGIVVIGLLGMVGLGSTEKKSNKREIEPEVRTVETSTVNYENIRINIEGNGTIESQRSLSIVGEASGQVTFAKNDLKNGTYVEKEEIILEIDSREAENNLYSLRSDFLNSIAAVLPELKIENLTIYKKWVDYFNSINIDEEIPELPQITNSQEKIRISSKGIFTKYYNVKNQEIFLSKHTIKAPYEGYISNGKVIKGSFVSVGKDLFMLEDVKNLEISVPLLVEEFNMINFDNPPKVKIWSEKTSSYLYGRILRKESNLNRNSQTLNVYVVFDNTKLNPYYLSGNYVHVAIEGKKLNSVAQIPRYVVDNNNNVFTIEDGKLNKKEVDIIAFQGDNAIIKNTIRENTEIVTTILQKPLIGMEIKSTKDIVLDDSDKEKEELNEDEEKKLADNK